MARKSKRKKQIKLRRESTIASRYLSSTILSVMKSVNANRDAKDFLDSLPVKFGEITREVLHIILTDRILKGKLKIIKGKDNG